MSRTALAAAVALALGTRAAAQIEPVGSWDGLPVSYADVWAEGDFAYVGEFGTNGVLILDISDPSAPTGFEYLVPPPNDDCSAQDVKVHDGLLFVSLESNAGPASVHVVDVRDQRNPAPLVNVEIPGFRSIHNTYYHDGFLYIVDSSTPRVGIVDLRALDPDNPPPGPVTQLAWLLQNVGTSFVHDVTVAGGRLYVCAWDSGLWVYDATSVADRIPAFIGNTPDGGDNTHSCWPTDLGDYVVTAEERTGGGIKLYRITDNGAALSLTLTDTFALPVRQASSVHNPLIVGYRVYNAWYQAGLQILDIDPLLGEFVFFAAHDTPQSFWGVYPFLGTNRVLASDRVLGLQVLAVTEPHGDLDGDGEVGINDLLALLSAWGRCAGPCPPACLGDLDGDCQVGINDLLDLLASWS